NVVVVAGNAGGSAVLLQARLRRRRLDDGAVRCKIAAQNRKPTRAGERIVGRADHVVVVDLAARDVGAEALAVDSAALRVEAGAELAEQGAQAARVIEILHQVFAGGPDVG